MRKSLIPLLLALLLSPHTALAARPNLILILTDDQRWDSLGCTGNPVLTTPHIDGLARGGILFKNAFVTTSICSISRASILTGQYARRHGIHDFATSLSASQFKHTFPAILRREGYYTGMIGKWGVGRELPKDEYDYFAGFGGQGSYYPRGEKGTGEHLTDRMCQQALAFLDDRGNEQPFLLQLYTKAPHVQDEDKEWPFQFARRHGELLDNVVIPPAPASTDEHFQALPAFLRNSEARSRWQVRFATPELYQKSVKDYYRLIAGVDEMVGEIQEKLREKGLADNTVIVFTSDNGFFLGEHGLAGKWFMYDESIRVPMIVYDPRLPRDLQGVQLTQAALNIDVAPTLLHLAGIQPPEEMQGRSLKPLMEGTNPNWREVVFYEHPFQHPAIAVSEGIRTPDWKYIRYVQQQPVVEQMFDLAIDPHETNDLAHAPQHQDQLDKLRLLWEQQRAAAE